MSSKSFSLSPTHISISPSTIILYSKFDKYEKKQLNHENSLANLNLKRDTLDLSGRARKHLTDSVNWFVYASDPKEATNQYNGNQFEFTNNFATVTLSAPQKDADSDIMNRMLQPLLNTFRQKYHVSSYIWRCEAQKNGNLHFHIMSNQYIPHVSLRNDWNKFQENLKYITRFEKKHGHTNPNSTDIHGLFSIENIGGYIGKYMSKEAVPPTHERTALCQDRLNDGYLLQLKKGIKETELRPIQKINCRLYGMSSNFPKLENPSMRIDSYLSKEVEALKEAGARVKVVNEYATIININNKLIRDTKIKAIPDILDSVRNAIIDQIN